MKKALSGAFFFGKIMLVFLKLIEHTYFMGNILDLSFPGTGDIASDKPVSGTITTQNLVPAGTATAASAVEIQTSGIDTVAIQTVGTYTGALTPQVTVDGSNWITLTGTPLLKTDGVYSATIPSAIQGVFVMDVSGYQKARLSANAAVTGSVVVSLRGSSNNASVAISNPLPTGTNSIGTVVLGAPATATTTSITKAEDAIHATADSGVQMLGVRYETILAAQAAGDYSFINVDDLSKLVTKPYSSQVNDLQGLTSAMTLVADTAVIAAPGASIKNMVTWVHVINTHATVGTEVHIKDGSTIIDRFYVAALSDKYQTYPTPLKTTANTALNAANVTTGSNTYVAAGGYKGL